MPEKRPPCIINSVNGNMQGPACRGCPGWVNQANSQWPVIFCNVTGEKGRGMGKPSVEILSEAGETTSTPGQG